MPQPLPNRKPEIMSPAGYWPQLQAAIEAGADSVYFGLTHFTARAKVGFSLNELPEVFRTLHGRGVKGYVTFNTLVFDTEMDEAARAVGAIAEAGADAVIVQDAGTVGLIRRIAPDLAIHGSTQMSITSAEGVRFADGLGVSRVVLARELSLDEVRAIRAQVDTELEIFVHGALCVAYSGQCFSSEAWGGRSANRGQCAQACRLPYEMIVDGRLKPLGEARYLLSPGDLYTLREIPEIVAAGVSSLKIEGRYKDAGYVALTTQAYRRAVDEAWAGQPTGPTREEELQLEQVYSRGLGPYFLAGTDHQSVVKGRAPRHRGVWMGHVVAVASDQVEIAPADAHRVAPLKPGDGLVFDAADWRSPEETEEGGRVYSVSPAGEGNLVLRFANGAVDFGRIRTGDLLWRTDDPNIERTARLFTQAQTPVRKQPVQVRAWAQEGEPLVAEWQAAGLAVEVRSPAPLEPAKQRALDESLLRDQFGRLGNTPYELAGLELSVEGRPFAPASLLNQMRREAVEKLQAAQRSCRPRRATALAGSFRPQPPEQTGQGPPELHLLVRSADQLEAALDTRPASITLDYLDLYGLRPSVDRIRHAGIAVRVASPRILKPGEEKIARFLRKLDCPLLVRSSGLLEMLKDDPPGELTGDFSLNIANGWTARLFLDEGLSRITPTHDLNAEQVAELARNAGGHRVEAIAYQHLPVFHTEHCVFCRFLSSGKSFKDCGRPCERHRIALKDGGGRAHPVMADIGCRNTVFGAEAQQAAAHMDLWRRAGIRHFRLEFVHESAAQVGQVVEAFQAGLAGRITAGELAARLARIAPQGTTEGSLFVPGPTSRQLPVLQ